VALLLIILLIGIIAIPTDRQKAMGTLMGYVHILVRYTLGFSIGVLMLATVWAVVAPLSGWNSNAGKSNYSVTKTGHCGQRFVAGNIGCGGWSERTVRWRCAPSPPTV